MNRIYRQVAVMVLCASSLAYADPGAGDADKPELQAATILETALREAAAAAQADQQIAVLQAAGQRARQAVPANVLVAELLERAAKSSSVDADAAVTRWRKAAEEAVGLLRFEPRMEAPLPEGFPAPTPVGEIRVQQFPAYRLAKTDMTFFEGLAFWTLFNHIKKHDIAMTAPVEMEYAADADQSLKPASMSFLYRSTQQGSPGTDEKVEVIDIPAQLAVSYGLQGDATKASVADAKRRLEDWLASQADEYEAAGPLRVMGYNSPFVPDSARYTEVQIPVRAKRTAREPQ